MFTAILQITAAIVLARIVWAILPVLIGVVFTAVLAVLAPVTTIKWVIASRELSKVPQVPVAPFDAKTSVARYLALEIERLKNEAPRNPEPPISYRAR